MSILLKSIKNQTNKITIYLNGVTQLGNPTNGTPALASGPMTIGAESGPGAFFDGYVSEVIVFDRALNNAEIVSVQNYLSAKYGIGMN